MPSNNGGVEPSKKMTQMGLTTKEGERITAPTPRPDGTIRKPIDSYSDSTRVCSPRGSRQSIYQFKGVLWKKDMAPQVGPPGYDPHLQIGNRRLSEKRDERKKEKRLQPTGKNPEAVTDDETKEDGLTEENLDHGSVISLTSQVTDLTVSQNPISTSPPLNSVGASDDGTPAQEFDKKKIRLAARSVTRTVGQIGKTRCLFTAFGGH